MHYQTVLANGPEGIGYYIQAYDRTSEKLVAGPYEYPHQAQDMLKHLRENGHKEDSTVNVS